MLWDIKCLTPSHWESLGLSRAFRNDIPGRKISATQLSGGDLNAGSAYLIAHCLWQTLLLHLRSDVYYIAFGMGRKTQNINPAFYYRS